MAEADNGGTLRTCFVVLRRWKWWVISLALLGLAASVALSLQQAKQYSATAQLLVQSPYGQGTSLGSTPQEVTATDVQTDTQLATSAPVLRMVRGKLGSAPTGLGIRGRLDERHRPDRRQPDASPGRAHRQYLRAGIRRAHPERRHRCPRLRPRPQLHSQGSSN